MGRGVVAARAGTVSHAGVVGSAGLTVAVRTADGRHVTSYLHLAEVAVKKGDSVAAGARIGAVGTSGRRSVAEPHLHFGVRLADAEDQYVDPLSVLPAPGPGPAPAPPPAAGAGPACAPRPWPAPVPVAVPLRASPSPCAGAGAGACPPAGHACSRAGGGARADRSRLRCEPGMRGDRRPFPPARRHGRRRPRRACPFRPPVVSPRRRRHAGPGQGLVLGGLGVIALVLFGGMAWRVAGARERGGEQRLQPRRHPSVTVFALGPPCGGY